MIDKIKQLIKKIFHQGAHAAPQMKKVWHQLNEIPQDNEMLIAINNEESPILCGPNNTDWETTVRIFDIIKWAYIKDLIPKVEE